jgi:predicted transcriptional regulator
MKKQTDRDRIYQAIKSRDGSTAREIAEMVGLDSPTTNSGIHNLVSVGNVFRAGETEMIGNRKFTLYSAINPVAESLNIPKQTWLSPVMQ